MVGILLILHLALCLSLSSFYKNNKLFKVRQYSTKLYNNKLTLLIVFTKHGHKSNSPVFTDGLQSLEMLLTSYLPLAECALTDCKNDCVLDKTTCTCTCHEPWMGKTCDIEFISFFIFLFYKFAFRISNWCIIIILFVCLRRKHNLSNNKRVRDWVAAVNN